MIPARQVTALRRGEGGERTTEAAPVPPHPGPAPWQAAGLAADNLICALYFSTLYWLARNTPPDGSGGEEGRNGTADAEVGPPPTSRPPSLSLLHEWLLDEAVTVGWYCTGQERAFLFPSACCEEPAKAPTRAGRRGSSRRPRAPALMSY